MVLENLWHAARIGTPAGHALQAVIQCAAAHLKRECGQPAGASRLVAHAETHAAWGGRLALGLDLRLLVAATRAHVAGASPVTLAVTAAPRTTGDRLEDL